MSQSWGTHVVHGYSFTRSIQELKQYPWRNRWKASSGFSFLLFFHNRGRAVTHDVLCSTRFRTSYTRFLGAKDMREARSVAPIRVRRARESLYGGTGLAGCIQRGLILFIH